MKENVGKITSVRLRNERAIWIREPADPSKASRLVVFLDGELYRNHGFAGSTIADSVYYFDRLVNR